VWIQNASAHAVEDHVAQDAGVFTTPSGVAAVSVAILTMRLAGRHRHRLEISDRGAAALRVSSTTSSVARRWCPSRRRRAGVVDHDLGTLRRRRQRDLATRAAPPVTMMTLSWVT
jgi:hypothetical protein